MIICASCKHQELYGALFCSECGAQLDQSAGANTGAFDPPVSVDLAGSAPIQPPDPASLSADALFCLQVVEHNSVIPLNAAGEYSIGRVNPGQTVLPDIDLSAYDAYSSGVSRVHASLTVGEGRAELRDLGSSNGTFLNGRRLTPHLPYALQHDDSVFIGKLQLRILSGKG